MTWKELKECIEQMSPEEQTGIVMMWSEYDQPRPAKHFSKADENLYVVDGWDSYCDENYTKVHPEKDIELVLEKGDYYLK